MCGSAYTLHAHGINTASVLKVDIKLSKRGFKCKPTKNKIRKWLRGINEALAVGRLLLGEASKLAGRLSRGSSALFRCIRGL